MKIKTACVSCFHEFAVNDQLLGKRVKCPACGEAVKVIELDDELVAHRSTRGGKSSKKSGTKQKRLGRGLKIGLGVGGGVLGVILIAVAVVMSMLRSSKNAMIADYNQHAEQLSVVADELEKIVRGGDAAAVTASIRTTLTGWGDSFNDFERKYAGNVMVLRLPADVAKTHSRQSSRVFQAVGDLNRKGILPEELFVVLRDSPSLTRYVDGITPESELPVIHPVPQIPLEECFAQLVALQEKVAELVQSSTNLAALKKNKSALGKLLNEQCALVRRVLELKSTLEQMPPDLRRRYDAAMSRMDAMPEPSRFEKGEMIDLLKKTIREHLQLSQTDQFYYDKRVLEAPSRNLTLVPSNAAELTPRQRELVAEMARHQTNAYGHKWIKTGETLQLILAYADPKAAADALKIGPVIHVDSDKRTIAMTIDIGNLPVSIEKWRADNNVPDPNKRD